MGALLLTILGVVNADNGDVIELYREEAMCVAPGRGALYRSKESGATIPGCWRPDSIQGTPAVRVNWLDVDRTDFPTYIITPVKAS
jgi:hypothetical protein